MNEIKPIKEMLKDGTYFQDALKWYEVKYIFPFTQRASVLVLTMILSVGLIISVYTARLTFASLEVPFPIYAKDEVNFFPIIKPLAHKTDSIEISVARYFIRKYIELREGYNPFDFTDDNKLITFNKIKAISSHYIYKQYQDFINPDDNTDSPIIKYKNQTQRLITVNNINIKAPDTLPESAVINFTAVEKSKSASNSEDFVAEISFMMSDITKVFEKSVPLYFTVIKYKTYKLSK